MPQVFVTRMQGCLSSVLPSQMLEEFKVLVLKEDSRAETTLDTLKAALLELDSLPPLCMETENAAEERKLAMEVFELATLLSVNNSDRDSFQRYMSCLKPFYTHYARLVATHCSCTVSLTNPSVYCRGGSSEITHLVLGLNLLYLLVENRLADFHCEVSVPCSLRGIFVPSEQVSSSTHVISAGAVDGRREGLTDGDLLRATRQAPRYGLVRSGMCSAV
jgi:hypothetical protein